MTGFEEERLHFSIELVLRQVSDHVEVAKVQFISGPPLDSRHRGLGDEVISYQPGLRPIWCDGDTSFTSKVGCPL